MVDTVTTNVTDVFENDTSDTLLSRYLQKSGMSMWGQPNQINSGKSHLEIIDDFEVPSPIARVDCGCNGGNCSC